jgi:hypothetical protein
MQLLIAGFYSYEKTWPMDLAHKKRAGPQTPLTKKELIINSYRQLF